MSDDRLLFAALCTEHGKSMYKKKNGEKTKGTPRRAKYRNKKKRTFLLAFTIDLFSLYVLFSHFRPRDATRGNSFIQVSSYARANVRITNEKK